jgi:2-hydroxy-6-oxonona-2,4-dienedioate hydrolase
MTAERTEMRATMWEHLMGVPYCQGYLDARGVRTRYLRAGPRGAPPLVLLHGTTGHLETYARNIAPHAEHFDVIAIDMLGHGYTDKPAVDYEIAQYAAHLGDVLDALGLDQVMMSGQSLGGWVAARFCLDHPQRVTRLCVNTTGGAHSNAGAMKTIFERTLAAAENPTPEVVRHRLEMLMSDPRAVTDELVSTRRRAYLRPGMVDATRRILCLQIPEIRDRNIIPDEQWSRLAVPTLIVWSTDDSTFPVSVGEKLHRLIAGSRLEILTGCGHWPQWEKADDFNRVHIRFMLEGS